MDYVEDAKKVMQEFEKLLVDGLKIEEADLTNVKAKLNFNQDVNTINNIESIKDAEARKARNSELDDIIKKYKREMDVLAAAAGIPVNIVKNDDKSEDNYFYNRDEFKNGKNEKVVEPENNEVEEEVEEEVVEVQESEEAENVSKKGNHTLRNILIIGGLSGLIIAVSVAAAKYGRGISCACANTKDNNKDNEKTEATTNNVTTSNDVIVPVTTTEPVEVIEVEPEVDIHELIAERIAEYEYVEGSMIRPEQYEVLINFANNTINEEVSEDFIVNNAIIPLNDTLYNEVAGSVNADNNGLDEGHDIGNFETSKLFVTENVTTEKLAELDILKDAMLNGDEQTKKDAAEQVMYIMYDIMNQASSSKETVIINGEVYNGKTIMGHEFGKNYNTEFYQLNDSSDQIIYLTYVGNLYYKASSILKDNNKIGNQTIFINEDGSEQPLQSETTITELNDKLFYSDCITEEGLVKLNLYSETLLAAVKESNSTLNADGESLILK